MASTRKAKLLAAINRPQKYFQTLTRLVIKGTLNETTLIFAHHRNKSILSEGDLSETTLKYEIPIDGKRV